MTTPQLHLCLILAASFALFAWGRWRPDLVAVLALLACVPAGLVPAERAFDGFAHPAVAASSLLFVVGAAARGSGLFEALTGLLGPWLRRPGLQVGAFGLLTALAAAFMGATAAPQTFLPAAQTVAQRHKQPPSAVLLPLAFAALLGGSATLVGSPVNLLVSEVRRAETGAGFGVFDFAPVGAALALAGLVYLVFAWRVLPRGQGHAPTEALVQVENFTSEVLVPPGSPAAGQTVGAIEARGEGAVKVAAVIREEHRRVVPRPGWTVEPGDVLVLACEPQALQRLMERSGLRIVGGRDVDPERVGVAEAVVTPGSELVGRSPREAGLEERHRVNLLAIGRDGGRPAVRLSRVKLRAGDVLVLQGTLDTMHATLAALGCLPLAERRLRLGRRRRAWTPALLLAVALGLAAWGAVPVAVALLGAVALLVLVGAVTLDELYTSVIWPFLVLLGAFVPVGAAVAGTGLADLAAGWVAGVAGGVGPGAMVALVLGAAMLLAPCVGSVPAALVSAPIAARLAAAVGASADPFLMAAAVGASCCFVTPAAPPVRGLGPGGYRGRDYRRLGGPLTVLVAAVALPVILFVWPPR